MESSEENWGGGVFICDQYTVCCSAERINIVTSVRGCRMDALLSAVCRCVSASQRASAFSIQSDAGRRHLNGGSV